MESETCVRLKAVFFLLKEGEEMNITELNNLRYIEKEIKLLQERIEELETEAARVTPILTGLPGKGSGGDRIGAVVEQLVEEKEKLEAALQQRQEERRKAMRFINSIADSQLRTIFFLRFLNGKSWIAVARYIGGNNTSDSVKKQAYRYLIKTNKKQYK